MDKLQNNYLPCKKCERNTLHYKRDKVMNWFLHIFLTFITGGIYLFVLAFIGINHALNKPADLWICSQCDQAEQPTGKKYKTFVDWLNHSDAGKILFLFFIMAAALLYMRSQE